MVEYIKIKKVEVLDTEQEMIDLKILNNNNFILDNGLITHNSGKTACALNIITQLHELCGFKSFIVDPKGTLGKIKEPALEMHRQTLKNSNLEPKGIDAHVILPSFLKGNPKYKSTDEVFDVTLDDFESIKEYSQRLELYFKFFRIDTTQDRPSQELLKQVELLSPMNFTDFLNKTQAMAKRIQVLSRNLKNAMDLGIVKDEGGIDIAQIMEEQLVIMQCSLSRMESYSPCYVTFALNQITSAQEKSRARPVAVLLDEVDILAPQEFNTPSKMPVRDLVTKYREMRVMSIFISQDANQIDEPTRNQVDYVCCPKVPRGTGASNFMSARGVNPNSLLSLHYGKTDSYPKEWKIISQDGQRNFFPIPPMCKC